ncbi:MAG TPA: MerR family transcriptional regulator [Rhodoglobus sp.]|nr:MerR family transcriptional regulator [Rhodoglobus sp.]
MRTIELARASGYSVQQVRDLERLGVLPPAEREANGYRRYDERHVVALRAYRALAVAAGPVEARALLARLLTAEPTDAAAAVDAVHARLHAERNDVLAAQTALEVIQAEPADGDPADAMSITELAPALGIRAATLRFWEQEGLLAPERITSLRVRRYPGTEIARARVVLALRKGGYGISAVRAVLTSLDDSGDVEHARHLLRERLDALARRSVALLHASADLLPLLDR